MSETKIKISCADCSGRGYKPQWEGTEKEEWLELIDCSTCKGTGERRIEIIDKRKKSKNKKVVFPEEY